MKIAYLHYHLKTGGVTTVIKQQLASVARQTEQLVITGDPGDARLDADVVHIPELAYSSDYRGTFKPRDAARSILDTIGARFGGPCDVLHVHNPTLAKNRHFLTILNFLQREGLNLLLQIHDFAEDGRPLAYFPAAYPADCHYGVINQRDYQILRKAGLKQDGLHLMENIVSVPPSTRCEEIEPSGVLYPIRAIRRKNLGEAILLSCFMTGGQSVDITLPPNSDGDKKSYRGWQDFVRDHGLNVRFERGLSLDFGSLVAAADFLISTSITEGFGFSFLEPWLFGKVLWGRKLTDICLDFENNGIRLDHLYTDLRVPLEWIGPGRFRDKWNRSISDNCKLFNVTIGPARLEEAFDRMTSDGNIDFGLLDESSQKKVVLRVTSSGRASAALIRINPYLAAAGVVEGQTELIEQNRQAILDKYSQQSYRSNLMNIYRKVSTTHVNQEIDKSILVSSFLNPEKFSLLKWGEYSG